jgi:hypothetical protein
MKTNEINRLPAPANALVNSARKKPAHDLRLGSIKAAIWENNLGEVIKYNVTFCRIYKDETEWKTSDSFGRDDLLVLAKLADQAHTWICTGPKPDR